MVDMNKFEKDLIKSAKQARAIARGEAKAGTYRIHVPPEIDVKELRKSLGLTQPEFAAQYGFSLGTLRDWEQKRSHPVEHSRAYLLLIQKDAEAVSRALSAA